MSGEWPEDPSDPRCPACGEPVSATASYCMHCETDLPGTDPGARETATGVDADAGVATAGASDADGVVAGLRDALAGLHEGVGPDDGASGSGTDRTTGAGGGTTATASAEDRGWLHPDSLLDDVSTVVAGIVAGPFLGVLASLVLLLVVPDLWPFVVGIVVWVVGTVWIARTRTVFGGVRKAFYAGAVLLVLLPVGLASGVPLANNTLGERAGFFLMFAVFTWPFALVSVAAGLFVGLWAADDEEG